MNCLNCLLAAHACDFNVMLLSYCVFMRCATRIADIELRWLDNHPSMESSLVASGKNLACCSLWAKFTSARRRGPRLGAPIGSNSRRFASHHDQEWRCQQSGILALCVRQSQCRMQSCHRFQGHAVFLSTGLIPRHWSLLCAIQSSRRTRIALQDARYPLDIQPLKGKHPVNERRKPGA